MRLLTGLLGSRTILDRPLSVVEAFTGVLLAASTCSGRARRREADAMQHLTSRMRLYEDVTPARWNAMIELLARYLERDGPFALAERCAAVVPDHLRLTLFANACDLVLADGEVEEQERQLLHHLQQLLEIDAETALHIVEVLIIKNKG